MLDPAARQLLDLIEQADLPDYPTIGPVEARKIYRDRRAFTQPEPPEVGSIESLSADGPAGPIPLRMYRPKGVPADEMLPVLVYYHGGGWTIGDLDTHDTLCRTLANSARGAVVAVDYRLGPEHRFPAAVDDAIAATRWVSRQAAALKVDARRLAVGGDSAGGNLAAVVSIAARDTGELSIAFQLLIYPATDMRCVAASHKVNGDGYLLTAKLIDWFRAQYIDDAAQYADWRASPLLVEDLSRLPDALVLTAGYDPLHDEGLAYADRLSAAGNRAVSVCFDRQIHGFILMGKAIGEANTAVQLCAAALRRAWST